MRTVYELAAGFDVDAIGVTQDVDAAAEAVAGFEQVHAIPRATARGRRSGRRGRRRR